MLRGYIGPLSIRPPLWAHLLCWIPLVFLPPHAEWHCSHEAHTHWLSTATSLWGLGVGLQEMLSDITSPSAKKPPQGQARSSHLETENTQIIYFFPSWGVSSQLRGTRLFVYAGWCRKYCPGTLMRQVLRAWDTTQSIPDGGVEDGHLPLDFPLLEVTRPLGADSPISLDWVVWMLGQSQRDSYWSRVGMEKNFSREFSTNKTSWQSLLTSIINCFLWMMENPALLVTYGDTVEECKENQLAHWKASRVI